jgi:hypothetical protein
MTSEQLTSDSPQITSDSNSDRSTIETEKILCPHCRRTATNGIKCQGICVADSDY